jgi:hypothetical protein
MKIQIIIKMLVNKCTLHVEVKSDKEGKPNSGTELQTSMENHQQ